MAFPVIHGPAEPEEYSWTVTVHPSETLTQVDDQTAVIEWADHTVAQTIQAQPAHDASGTSVPTTISISEGNVVILTVHHRAGNPAAGGTPFDYPVNRGAGWAGGFVTEYGEVIEPSPPVRAAKAACIVPRLTGKEPQSSKRILRAANCKLGKMHHQRTGSSAKTVVRQGPRPGTELPWGSRVWITVGGA